MWGALSSRLGKGLEGMKKQEKTSPCTSSILPKLVYFMLLLLPLNIRFQILQSVKVDLHQGHPRLQLQNCIISSYSESPEFLG